MKCKVAARSRNFQTLFSLERKKKCRLLLHFPRARFFFLVFQLAVLREKEFGFIWQRKPGDYSRDRKLVVVAELKLEQKRPLNTNNLFFSFLLLYVLVAISQPREIGM